MVSLITAFKDFTGLDRIHQRSALRSWAYNDIPVFTVNNEPQVKSNCDEFKVVLVPGRTARDLGFENNSPVLKDLLLNSLCRINTPMVGLINGDILVRPDFKEQLRKITDMSNIFLSGIRHDLDLKEEIETEEALNKFFMNLPALYKDTHTSADLFISSADNFRKMAEDMPDFIMGRYGWDNWIHYWVVSNSIPHYDCTKYLPILHCIHDHNHIEKQEKKMCRQAPSSQHNLSLLKSVGNLYKETIDKWPQM